MPDGRDAFNWWFNRQVTGYPAYNDFLVYVRSKGQPTEGVTYLNFKEHPLYAEWVSVMEWAQTSGKAGAPPTTQRATQEGKPWLLAPSPIPTVRERMERVGLPTAPWTPEMVTPLMGLDPIKDVDEIERIYTNPAALELGMLPTLPEGQGWIFSFDTATNKKRWVVGPAEAEARTGVDYVSESYGGQNLLFEVDSEGNKTFVAELGPTDTGMTQYQEAQLGLSREQLAWQQSQGAASERLEREKLLASLTGPQDWIKYWQMQRGPASMNERVQNLNAEAMIHLQAAQPLSGGERLREEMAAEKLFDQAEKLMGKQAAMPTTPPSPEWLPQFAPSQVAGQPITAGRIPTPSGQQFAGMAESQRAGLAGYAQWGSAQGPTRTWGDIMSHMEMMQPSTPSGAGRERWQPARQRV